MKEEKTQGIDTETTTKDSYNTNKKTKETELLDLRAGYNQHTSPRELKFDPKPMCVYAYYLTRARTFNKLV